MERALTTPVSAFVVPHLCGAFSGRANPPGGRLKAELRTPEPASPLVVPHLCGASPVGSRASAGGFTLIELLVATAIVMLFAVLAVNMATDTLRQSEAVNSKLKSNLQARLVMDWITRDIQTALVRRDGGEWLRMEPSALNAGIALPVCTLMLLSQAGELHTGNSTSAGSSTLSGPAAILYGVDYRDPTAAAASSSTHLTTALFRFAMDPGDTFAKCFVPYSQAAPLGNIWTDIWEVEFPNGVQDIEAKDLLIQNVAGFQVAFEFLTANGTTVKSGASETFSAGVSGGVRAGTTAYPAARVLSAEVTLWLLDPAGTRALKQGTLSPEEFFTRHARPFVRKIAIPSQ